jgi:pimeloyl-ACP methyl ester carboxylesterase
MVGGLAHTRFPVTPLGMLVHKHTGCTTMMCSLPILKNLERGIDPMTKEEIADALRRDIAERAAEYPGIVAVGYSTGGLGILELANRGLIKPLGLACIGVPLHLKNPEQQAQLDQLLERADGYAQSMFRFFREPLFHRFARTRWIPVEPLPSGTEDRLEQKNACLTGIYVETLLALRQYQQEIRKGLSNISCPSFIAVGRNDNFATVNCALALGSMMSGASRIHIYDESPHGVQLGPERRRFYRDFFTFLERDLKLLPEEQSKLIRIRESAA